MSRKKRTDVRQLATPIFVVLLLGIAVNVALWAFLVRPKAQAYQAMAAGGGKQLEALEERRATIEQLEGYVDALEKAQNDMKTLRQDVLSTRALRMVDVNAEITGLSDRFNIPVEQVNYGTEILEREELDRYDISLPLEGSYSDLRRFLQAVESSEKFLIVEKVALRQSSDPAARGKKLQLNIDLATYFTASEQLLESWRSLRAKRGGA